VKQTIDKESENFKIPEQCYSNFVKDIGENQKAEKYYLKNEVEYHRFLNLKYI
jgi:hypothetical protein